MVVPFRNLRITGEDPVESWPYEALVTTMERGMVSDWQPILTAIREQPFGCTARSVAGYVKSDPDDQPAAAFFALALKRSRHTLEEAEKEVVITRIKAALLASGLSQSDFATRIGTSASRFSTYVSGQVTPSASMLVRIEQVRDGPNPPSD